MGLSEVDASTLIWVGLLVVCFGLGLIAGQQR